MRVAPYGTWESPVRPEDLAETHAPSAPDLTEDGLYWLEVKPDEGGRSVLVWCPRGGEPRVLTPPAFNVRTRVHEYGGGEYWRDGETIFFSHFEDGRLYRQDGHDGEPRPITPEPGSPNSLRYADGRVLPDGSIVCVRESHEEPEVVNALVLLPGDGSLPPRPIRDGKDFYASPRPSPDGRRLCWLAWNHPQLPFTGTELWAAELVDGGLENPELVAGGPDEAVFQPGWDPAGRLHWVSDRTGWWNLYREGENLTPLEGELGAPAWRFDMTRYGFLADGRIACVVTRRGIASLELLDPETGSLEPVDLPYMWYASNVRTCGNRVAVLAAGAREPEALIEHDAASGETTVYAELPSKLAPEAVSVPIPLEIPSGDGPVHAFLYRPYNPEFEAPDGERPPLIVRVHGGPTAAAAPLLEAGIQFWTSRGFACVEVNYGGSTGYGRRYRERLDGQWGVVDVADSIAVARHLVDAGEADGDRLVIQGGSAGGYTTLCALAFEDVFAAGVNYFGVVDLETFAQDTHKFEARYLDLLIGPYPEARELYRERSPVDRADDIRAPLLTFQGLDDRVVPPSQSEQLIDALDRNGVPYAYLAFEGEGHGFRRRENLVRAPEATLAFLAQIFELEPADELEPLEVKNRASEPRTTASS
jgi:dipeptidyl aminopeptidase/acylaminoacyl peptidase